MMTSIRSKFGRVLCLGLVAVALTGCGKKLSGKYTDDSSQATVEFKDGGKASVTVYGQTMETTFTEDGDKVTIAPPAGKSGAIVLKKGSDGSLSPTEGPLKGTLKPKA